MPITDTLPLPHYRDPYAHGVSWGSAIAGAFVSAALSLLLLALGAGFGLSEVSPWSHPGNTAVAIGTTTIVWLVVSQIIASGMGGFLAGRLRPRWDAVHAHEVHFRDTATGFLAWAVGVVVTAAFLTAAASYMVGAAASNPENTRMARGAEGSSAMRYYTDRLFRSDRAPTGAAEANTATNEEADRVFTRIVHSGDAGSGSDAAYLAQLVSARTGLSQADAQKRVTDTVNDARQAEDAARAGTARLLLWTFLALLIGAFCASFMATFGGRQRDAVLVS